MRQRTQRRNHHAEDSLELLLDTITNAFGGVLFLAILITIQLRTRGASTVSEAAARAPSEVEVIRLGSQLQKLTYERSSLLEAISRQEATLDDLRGRADNPAIERLASIEADRVSLETERRRSEDEIKDNEDAISEMSTAHADMQQASAKARRELSELESKLKDETESRTVSGRLPRTRLSLKHEFPIVLRYGKLYQLRRPDGRWNSDQFFVQDGGDTVELEPKPYRGLPLADNEDFETELKTVLARLHPARDHIGVLVWYDSFRQFEQLKRVLVQLNYEYRLILVEKGGSVSSGFVTPWVQ